MHRRSSASARLFLSCTANCVVRIEICRKLLNREGLNVRDGRDGCPVSATVAAWYGEERVTAKLNQI